MAKLPAGYAWLNDVPAPRMLVQALKLYGIKEREGSASNPVILNWANELGIKDYIADSIPWCGLFMAYVCEKAGREFPKAPLWALNWAKWGIAVPRKAELGDVLVFQRPSGGHVGLYVGEDVDYYHVLAGNQGDAVSITRIAKSRCVARRRPKYINKPSNVRRVFLSPTGSISNNEA